ncbi:gamma-glutamyltransferase family protein [Tersicoccus mangrovi]|uniref:gamma-glutamyltransferase family protein n=1 Tax=Tersicoccus mangrovi TaxID=3121635 RepID=UPI003A7F456F
MAHPSTAPQTTASHVSAFTTPPAHTTRPTLKGSFGMVSSTHWLASAAAQAVLERGGNAFDAAVAGAFVLHVVEPHLNGPGGDLVALVTTDAGPRVLMGQGPAPAGATIEHYRAAGLDLVPGAGALAAVAPGAVDAWLLLLAERGTWELADVLAFAVHYARHGHPAVARIGMTVAAVADLFTEHWPTSAAQWMPDGRPPADGEVIRNEAWARTLDRLVEAGAEATTREARIEAARAAFASGFVAAAVEEFSAVPHRHSGGGEHAGVITAADMGAFRASLEEPCSAVFRGRTVVKTGPWGQGPVLLQTLAILDGFDDERLDPSTELGAHTILEALKLALADRDAWYGEAAAGDAELLAHLLSPEYAAQRRALITERASAGDEPGEIPGRTPHRPPRLTPDEFADSHPEPDEASAGEPTVARFGRTRGDTCHLDVVDRDGNMIAATPSGGWLQSNPTIPELGFCLGTRLQMTWLDEGSPAALRPGARPRTTLTPTMLLDADGRPEAVLGSPGGDQQDQWQLLYLLRTLVGGYSPQQAIDAPMLHTTAMVGSFWPRTVEPYGAVVEDRLGDDVIAGLERRGHRITRAGDWSLGRMCVAGREPDTGVLYAAANPRGAQGYATGR